MKKQTFSFLRWTALGLACIPVLNALSAWVQNEPLQWTRRSFWFGMDHVSRLTAAALYPLGWSTDSKNVMIGKEHWLFLGDAHSQTLTTKRHVLSEQELQSLKWQGAAIRSWQYVLRAHGVQAFHILVGPDKDTVYSEQVPDWAGHARPSVLDTLFAHMPSDVYVDVRQALQQAKQKTGVPLYMRTDTHWNALGSSVAFRSLWQQLSASQQLSPLPSHWWNVAAVEAGQGGDLGRFLRIAPWLEDTKVMLQTAQVPLQVQHRTGLEGAWGAWQPVDGNKPMEAPHRPTWFHAEDALHSKKVLWLRDSFGNEQSPFMHLAFSDVIQQHWMKALPPDGDFWQLVASWKPDYVFFTVVERSARHPDFRRFAPVQVRSLQDRTDMAAGPALPSPQRTNHLQPTADPHGYVVQGNDPWLEYVLPARRTHDTLTRMRLHLQCEGGDASPVPVQVFWADEQDADYAEERSFTMLLPQGGAEIDLRSTSLYHLGAGVQRLRLDVDGQQRCPAFQLQDVVLAS